jgi:hypothetical protein
MRVKGDKFTKGLQLRVQDLRSRVLCGSGMGSQMSLGIVADLRHRTRF